MYAVATKNRRIYLQLRLSMAKRGVCRQFGDFFSLRRVHLRARAILWPKKFTNELLPSRVHRFLSENNYSLIAEILLKLAVQIGSEMEIFERLVTLGKEGFLSCVSFPCSHTTLSASNVHIALAGVAKRSRAKSREAGNNKNK